jgi:drug/metabolite transporter (DMT)-like permease
LRPISLSFDEEKRSMKPQDGGLLLLLGAIWGGSFLFIRVAAPALGPFLLVESRVALAALGMLPIFLLTRARLHIRAQWRSYLLLGLLNAALPFLLISAAELRLTASLAAILNATTPLFAALVAAGWLKERLTLIKIFGLILGACGVAVIVGLSPLKLSGAIWLSAGASLLAALSYALAGTFTKLHLKGEPALNLSFVQQVAAALLVLPLAWNHVPSRWPSPGVLWAVALLAILSTAMAYPLYFRLISRVGPTNALLVTFLVPLFGVLWGVIFLHEIVGWETIGGMAIVFASLALITGFPIGPRSLAKPSLAVPDQRAQHEDTAAQAEVTGR